MKIFLIILSIILVLTILSFIVIGGIAAKLMVYPNKNTRKIDIETGTKDGYYKDDGLEKKDISFIMKDGYVINGDITEIENSKGLVVISHGYSVTREISRIFAALFHELGYSTVCYDQRGHGDNVKFKCSLGMNEGKDLNEIVKQLRYSYSSYDTIGIMGYSMGAASCIIAGSYHPKVDFIISDSSYSYLNKTMRHKLKNMHLPHIFSMPFLRLFYNFMGFNIKSSSPINYVKNLNAPILFIHGTEDDFVPYKSLEELYNACPTYKEKVSFSGLHVKSIINNYEEYKKRVELFLCHLSEKKDII